MESLQFFYQMTNTLWGTYGFQALFYVSLILILLLEKRKLMQAGWLGYSACIFLIIYNPIMYFICKYIFGAGSDLTAYYCRLFCLLPIVFAIAYAFTLLMRKTSKWKKLCCTFLLLLTIALNGRSAYGESWFVRASNVNKVPADVIQICALFPAEEDQISIMVPAGLTVYMRQIDSRFRMPYGRYQYADIGSQLQSETQNLETILSYAAETSTDYIVSLYQEELLSQYMDWGCELVGRTDNYMVLKQHCPKWVLTQYADATGNQAMFYMIQNMADKTLIVIDGGWAENAEQVRNVILEKGGTVNAWILTHYHPDHIGAFNNIYQDPQGITINGVYATSYDVDLFQSAAQEWDGIDTFHTFVDHTADANNINYVARDTVLEFSDMKITFYNCWDNLLENIAPGDVLNNASLVFKVETPKTSVLFCGDCHGDIMSDFLIRQYGTRLQADYVQPGHHGNNSLTTDFYTIVSPTGVLFDAPGWLMTGENYSAKDLAAYFQEKGIVCYDYRSAPNRFFLH